MNIYSTTDECFAKFGKVIESPYYHDLKDASVAVEMPSDGTKYFPSVAEFERDDIKNYYAQLFGGLDVQIGCCLGRNKAMNALEWHKSSEIVVALSDMILLLGDIRDMENGKYDSKNLKAFFVMEGESVELYSTTLHFCPINVKDTPFTNVVVLPKGTNTPLESPTSDKRLISKNKWLIIHKDFKAQVELGRDVSIVGENIVI